MSPLTKIPLIQLELYTLLVYYGIKDAYLVDCCCLSSSEASAFISHFQAKYALSKNAIITVLLDFDILFVNRESLCKKISFLEQQQNIPVVIDTGTIFSILPDTTAQMEFIYNLFKDVALTYTDVTEFVVPITESLQAVVGLPFVAGWLLGYPCLYRAQDSPAASEMAEDSSMINLVKYSISAEVCLREVVVVSKKKGKTKGKSKGTNLISIVQTQGIQTMEVMGFSIPERLLEGNAHIQAQLQSSVDHILLDMQQHTALIASTNYLNISNYVFAQTVHTVPKLAL